MMKSSMADLLTRLKGIESTYETDQIVILGKGRSADSVPPSLLSDSLVIGINDAERIGPVDVTVFHADWVPAALASAGFGARLYVGARPLPNTVDQVVVPHVAMTQESSGLLMQRLLSDDDI